MPKPINGLFGFLYDEEGDQVQGTQEFESTAEFEKQEYLIPGKFYKKHEVLNGTISGSATILKMDSRLQKKIFENPEAKYNYIGKLKRPGPNGEEAILYKGVSFDGTPLLGYSLEELVEFDLDWTADDAEYLAYMI
ncbi:phage tail tube protein [Domibacillus indicus]|uniref:phage tail tube protein n=1 Tax=Domibacillus indicus TaxID=1437523 RepID=UPI0020405339|nr:phage tail tube protein [Domibacillus indicus]MCM3789423.1 phage tail tube protein [Domibacillus indicus]